MISVQQLLRLSFIGFTLFLTGCNGMQKEEKDLHDEMEEQDGILEAQRMEFLATRDVELGYVPGNRLIQATEDLKTARLNGSYTSRINALNWTERGSYADAVGPSNGNLRTTGAVTSGRVRAICVDNGDPSGNTVWAAGIDGGLWKTTDITASPAIWTPVSDFFSNLAISGICQDPTDPAIMYFGTGEKTFNADAVRGGGVWRSTDHGVNWSLLGATTVYFNISKILCDASGNIFISTVNPTSLVLGAGLYRSTKASGGASWTNIAPATMASFISDFEISSTGRMHINVGQSEGAGDLPFCGYRYTDNPATVTSGTWTAATTPYPASTEGCELACSGNTLIALRVSSNDVSTIYKSTDGGDTWAATGSTPSFTSGQAWYCLSADFNPADANQIIVGSLDNYKSTDGGATWSQISDWVCTCGTGRYIHADQHIVKWYTGNRVLFGCDGGVFYSPDGGATVADKNTNLRLKQFYSCAIHPTSANYFLAGAQDNGVHQFNGAGLTSSVEVTGGDGAFVHIDEDQPQYQWGSYTYNNYRRSVNSGTSWSSVTSNSNGSFINPTDYDDMNNIMYCGRNANQYIRWSNAQTGGTLTQVSMTGLNGGYVSHVHVSPYTANRVYFGGGNNPSTGTGGGKILAVDNANATPVVTDITGSGMSANRNVSCIAVGTTDNNLIATFSNYGVAHVWVSTTGGGAAGWTNISGNLPDIPVRWAMFYPEDNTQAIIATEMGIYETSLINGASTNWVQNSAFPVVRTNMLQYRFSDNTVLAASHGRGLWSSTITPSLPYIRFASSYIYSPVRNEATGATSGCRRYTDYTIQMHIDKAPAGTATVTLGVAGGSTATQGVDYDFTTNGSFSSASNVVTFLNGTTADQPVTIRVYNDAEVESGTEFFRLNYVVSGSTDAVAAPSSSSYTFYIGENDVAPTSTTVETVLNNNITEHIGDNGNYYFYSSAAGRIINNLSGSTGDLGCVSSTIYAAGSVWQSFEGGTRSQKIVELIPTTNPGSTFTLGLYFISAELAGNTPGNLKIARTTAATIAAANATNTTILTTSVSAYNGSNYVFTATVSGNAKFFLVDNAVALPVNLVSFSGYLNASQHSDLRWQTTNEFDLENFEIQRSYDGIHFANAGTVTALANPALLQDYHFEDPVLAKAVCFYRLKMVDKDGKFKYSAIVKVTNSRSAKFIELLQNPVKDHITFMLNNPAESKVVALLFSSSGQAISRWDLGNQQGSILLPIDGLDIAAGIYILRISAGSQSASLKIRKE